MKYIAQSAAVRLIANLFLLTLSSSAVAEDIRYPANIGIIDVTQAPYNADPTGSVDATATINQALRDITKDASGKFGPFYKGIVYLPNGTYKVSGTIALAAYPEAGSGGPDNKHQRIQGQSEASTIIKLADGAAGFTSASAPKPVISYLFDASKNTRPNSNVGMSNMIANLTVDVGAGNPGAIAIRFHANNSGVMRHVTIRSSDPAGAGFIGLDLRGGTYGPSWINDIHVDGFDTGMSLEGATYNFYLENINLTNQRTVGLLNANGVTTIRKMTSVNTVPAIRQTADRSGFVDNFLQLFDSSFTGGGDNTISAINNQVGYITARNVTTSGYARALTNQGTDVAGNTLDEYTSFPPQSALALPELKTLNLPVKDVPEVPWDDPAAWAGVDAFKQVGDVDDTAAIQRAIDSGATTVYFTVGMSYTISKPILVRNNVRRIICMWSTFLTPNVTTAPSLFKIVDGTSDVILIERIYQSSSNSKGGVYAVDHATKRTVILRDLYLDKGSAYRNSVQGGQVFIENVHSIPGATVSDYAFNFDRQQVWARQMNPERCFGVLNNGGTLWTLGFKMEWVKLQPTEVVRTMLTTTNGGQSEVLGGYFYPIFATTDASGQQVPLIINDESHVSATLYERPGTPSGNNFTFEVLVREIRGGVTKDLTKSSGIFPRTTRFSGSVIPLYVGYTVPRAPTELTATAIGNNRIELRWKDNTTTENGFKVERSTDNTVFTEVASLGADATTYTDTNLSPATAYYYRVRAFNASGSSAYSDAAIAMTSTTTDVTSQINVTGSGLIYNRRSRTFNGTITIINTSDRQVATPLQLVLAGLTQNITLVNADGVTTPNSPYLSVAGDALAPGASITVDVEFANANNTALSYTPKVYAGTS